MTTEQGERRSEQAVPTVTEMFLMPEQARSFDRLIGNWDVQGALTVDGAALPMKGRWEFCEAAAGWGVRASLRATIEGMGAYEEDDLAGFDVETG